MKMIKEINKSKLKLISLSVIIFGLIAHIYCFLDFNFSHDSTILIQNDINWQISLGRFLHPLYVSIRGSIYSPVIIGVFSIIWVIITTYYLTDIFKIKNKLGLILTSGILITNSVITLTSATYIHELDIYMFSLLCSVLAVYLCNKYDKGYIFSIILLFISLGLYQSYFQVAIIIFMLLLITDLLDKKDYKIVLKKALKYLLILISSIILYYIGVKLALYINNIDMSNSYNGLSNLGNLLNIEYLFKSIIKTYLYMFYYFINPRIYNPVIISVLTILTGIITITSVIYLSIKKLNKKQIILLLLILILIPLGGNIIYLIAGMEHDLMVYSFFILYIFIISLTEIFDLKENIKYLKFNKYYKILVNVTCILLIFNSVIFSNQIYVKKRVEYQYTYSLFNRIIDDIESDSLYKVNDTKVIFIGSLINNSLVTYKPYFYYNCTGIWYPISVTYLSTYSNFINNIMSYPMNIVLDENIINEYSNIKEVVDMEVYPSKDSYKMINGYMVVKLS